MSEKGPQLAPVAVIFFAFNCDPRSLSTTCSQAYALSDKEGPAVSKESRLRAGLFVAQYKIMYADPVAAIEMIKAS